MKKLIAAALIAAGIATSGYVLYDPALDWVAKQQVGWREPGPPQERSQQVMQAQARMTANTQRQAVEYQPGSWVVRGNR